MRIISGSKKSFIVRAPKNLPVRPTTDKLKESLFNIIQNKYEFSSLKVLDIFAGTGNISYEFGSRVVQIYYALIIILSVSSLLIKQLKILILNLEQKKLIIYHF